MEERDALVDPLGSPLARAVFETGSECQIILDPEGIVVAVNRAFCELYAIDAADTIGQHYMAFSKDFEIRRFGDSLAHKAWVTAAAMKGETIDGVLQGVLNRVTGREFFGRYAAVPYFEHGKQTATIISVLDVTESTRQARALGAALSAAEVGTWRADVKEGKVWADENYAKLCGLPAEELNGAPLSKLYALIHPDDRDHALTIVREATEARTPHEVEFRVVRPDGSIRWLISRGMPTLSDSGEPSERIGSIVDVTRQKESEEMLRATTDAIPVLVSYLDHELVYRFCNGAYERFFGMTRESIVGRSVLELVGPKAFDQIGPRLRKALDGEEQSFSMQMNFPELGPRFVRVEYRPRRGLDGRVEGVYALVVDETDRRRVEEALRESEERLRQVAEGLPQMVWSARPDGVRDIFNGRWLEYTGVGLTDRDDPWREALHPDDRPRAMALWRHSVEGGETFQAEYRLRSKEGAARWFLGRAIPLRNEAAEIVRWFGTCTDIDDQKATQRALEISNQFAQTLADDLDLDRIVQALTDASTLAVGAQFGSFFYNVVNESGEALQLFSLSGAPIAAFEKFGMPRATKVFAPTFRAEGIVRSDDITKDPRYGSLAPHHGMPAGHLPVASYLAVPVVSRSGETIGALLFGHSKVGVFTAEHEGIVSSFAAQAAVAMDNARLYDRVRGMKEELEAEVRSRTADLQASNEALRGFTYHVSHDLRAPLRTIASSSHIVQEDFGDALPAEAHAILGRQAEAAGKLGQLIDDLLKLSRLSQEEIVKSPLDLSALAQEAATESLSSHPDANVEITVEDGLRAKADPRLLKLALINLIENAVKYSPQGGSIHVGQRPEGAYFVSDQGIGIDPRYFSKIFEPFQRLHRDDEFAGTGIGLSNVRQVVERHGGKLWVESEVGKGSTFLFTLG